MESTIEGCKIRKVILKKCFFLSLSLLPVTIHLFMDFCKGGRDKSSNKGIRAEAEEAEATEVQSL